MNRELQNMSEESLQNLEEIVETELLTVEDIRERMDTTEKGKIRQSIQNCKYALEHDPCLKGAICRNEMTCQIDIMKKMPWKRRGVHMTDTDMNNLALYLEKNYGLTSDRVITKAIDIVANENSFHPILEYLESLKWDGIPRIQHMLTHFFGAEDIGYTGEVMKMHMMGAIRRLYEPGAKYDIMLCLVGGQGTGKSTFFRYLAIKDEWFTDDMKRIDDKKVCNPSAFFLYL
ncbi:VapE domain-containing protein [Coprococcus comes]|uniref:VapE domain-containing protein n=1 Tax=Coprococcus comes TaxID=410072 RepID=UPI001FABA2E6|nr:VapE domain-containing protein [Coprococcus comes]